MFYHVVMMELSDGAGTEFHQEVERYVQRIREECGGVLRYDYCTNVASRAKGYSHVVLSAFESSESHDCYQVSPLHQALKAHMTPCIVDLVVFDSDVPNVPFRSVVGQDRAGT
jgi:quinol monooxygenase YgiN